MIRENDSIEIFSSKDVASDNLCCFQGYSLLDVIIVMKKQIRGIKKHSFNSISSVGEW